MTWARDQFPVLDGCVYLNANSFGATPIGCTAVLADYWGTLREWRDELFSQWWAEILSYCDELAALIGAPSGTVVVDANMSSLLGRVASGLRYQPPRTRVVTTDLEFPTMEFVWRACERLGAELSVVASRDGVSIATEDLLAAIDEHTRIVCVSHASYLTGALVDLAAVTERAHAVGALVAVDAYQSLGAVPLDVAALDVDIVLGGAHKWLCGAFDLGFAYVRPAVCERIEPVATGWMASAAGLSFEPCRQYAANAWRLASGSPAPLPAMFSRVGLEIIAAIGIDAIRAASLARTARIIERADELGIEVATPREPHRRGAIVCLRMDDAGDIAAELTHRGYVCSHRRGIRVAPHFYNTDDEIEAFMDELATVRARRNHNR